MTDDRTGDHDAGGFHTRGEGELCEDGFDDNDGQVNHQQYKHELSKEQMMDQAIEKKDPIKPGSPEALGVTWTEGTYSGKNLRSTCLFVWLATIFFVAVGILMMVKGAMGDYGTFWWTFLLIVPVCAWVWFGCIYIYRTKTIRYRLTQHRFYNEEGLFTKTVDTLELINIEDMTLKQSLVDRVINGGTGTIILMSNDQSHPTLKVTGVENPRAAFESIDELRRRERNARVIRSVT
ncbi:MAG: PH domain-containing protein [Planctomycetaceae bacterium]|nr:PH domain-containing protein [Planctomycetaceae bacterium]